jgi:ribonuclease E
MEAPSFDSPPALALEEEFAASEADYSQAPSPRDAVLAQEATAEPARTSTQEAEVEPTQVAATQKPEVEGPAPVAGAVPIVESSAPAKAEPAPDPASERAPAVDEPTRPRRSGWWQRARASVIGE